MIEGERMTTLKWYERFAVRTEAAFEFNVRQHGFKKWALSGHAGISREYNEFRCFWPRFWFQILGFSFGAGMYYTPNQRVRSDHIAGAA